MHRVPRRQRRRVGNADEVAAAADGDDDNDDDNNNNNIGHGDNGSGELGLAWRQTLADSHNVFVWAMNVLAVTHDGSQLFVARTTEILAFDVTRGGMTSTPTRVLRDHSGNVTAMKMGRIGTDEVLASVDERGLVVVHFTSNLDRPPLLIQNDSSTWGIAFNTPQRLLAVSANSHNIRLVELGVHTRGHTDVEEDNPGIADMRLLAGHTNNIPSIDISPCGNYVVSASIDSTCRLWDLRSKLIKSRSISRSWGWGARFIPVRSARSIPDDDVEFSHGQSAFGRHDDSSPMTETTFDIASTPSSSARETTTTSDEHNNYGIEDDDEGEDSSGASTPTATTAATANESTTIANQMREHGQLLYRMLFDRQRMFNHGNLEREALERSQLHYNHDLEESLIVFTTHDVVALLDCNSLATLASYTFTDFFFTHSLYAGELHRLTLHVYVPEMSLLVIGSQGTPYVLLLELVRCVPLVESSLHYWLCLRWEGGELLYARSSRPLLTTGNRTPQYRLRKWPRHALLPTRCPHSILSGLDVAIQRCAHTNMVIGVRLFLLYLSGDVLAFDVDHTMPTGRLSGLTPDYMPSKADGVGQLCDVVL